MHTIIHYLINICWILLVIIIFILDDIIYCW